MSKRFFKTPQINFEALNIAFWSLKLVFQLSPKMLISKIITGSLLELNPIISSIVTSILLNFFIQSINSKSFDSSEFARIILIYILHTIVYSSVVRLYYQYCSSTLRRILRFNTKILTAEKLHYLGVEFLENSKNNNLITRSRENFNRIEILLEINSILVGLTISFVASGLILINFSPILALSILIISIPRFLLNRKFIQKEYALEKNTTVENRKSEGNMSYLIHSSTLKEVLSLNAFGFLMQGYKNFANKLITIHKKYRAQNLLGIFLFRMLEIPIFIYLFSVLIKKLVTGIISIGYANIILSNSWTFSNTISGLVGHYTDLTESTMRLVEIKELFESKRNRNDGNLELNCDIVPPAIKFDNVSFKYPDSDRFIFKNFNLTINSGEKIAIVGHNGAGKTTLVKILTKIYTVNNGSISIAENKIDDLDTKSLNHHVGILFQDYNTYEHLTVRDNVLIGNATREVTDEKIWEALEMADAKEFVNEYPRKLDTMLSEKYEDGIRPSTGQWQKIAIARFFYKDSPVLILDEPTASIDAVAEANIFDRIYKFIENKTVVIISHRFSTVRNADRIIVLDKGEIIEQGSHPHLMSLDGKYAHAFNLQAKGYTTAT